MTQTVRTALKWLAEPLVAVLFVLFATTAIAQPFYVPSGSMQPTLAIGDAFLASKFAYGYSAASLPLVYGTAGSRVMGHMPKQGDIVVFRHPTNPSEVLVKRVIGLPGDTVQMRAGHLFLNGRELPLQAAGSGMVEDAGGQHIEVPKFSETLPNGVVHAIYKWHWDGMMDDTAPVTIPAGHLFMMGDNRDDSLDSRVTQADGGVGLVPAGNLIGRAELLIGSYDFLDKRGPASWLERIRLSRFLHAI